MVELRLDMRDTNTEQALDDVCRTIRQIEQRLMKPLDEPVRSLDILYELDRRKEDLLKKIGGTH